VNPARSTGVAVFAGGWALSQLWAFWVAPIVGAVLAGFVYTVLAKAPVMPVPLAESKVSESMEP
jgi:aquaporin Z